MAGRILSICKEIWEGPTNDGLCGRGYQPSLGSSVGKEWICTAIWPGWAQEPPQLDVQRVFVGKYKSKAAAVASSPICHNNNTQNNGLVSLLATMAVRGNFGFNKSACWGPTKYSVALFIMEKTNQHHHIWGGLMEYFYQPAST